MSRRASKYIYGVLLVAPIFGAVLWSIEPALRTAAVVYAFDASKNIQIEKLDPWGQLKLRRDIQRYLSDRDTYIPQEDIDWKDEGLLATQDTSRAMQNRCGQARLLVWVPLRFKLPIIGEKVIEWCWKL